MSCRVIPGPRCAHRRAPALTLALVGWMPAAFAAEPGALGPAPAAAAETAAEAEPAAPAPRCVASVSELGVAVDDPRASGPAVLVLSKGARSVQLFEGGRARMQADGTPGCWRVALGGAPVEHKEMEGDGRTPLGWYRTSDKPDSSFKHAILIHYPNAADARAGLAAGRISPQVAARLVAAESSGRRPDQSTALGGQLLLHGGGSAYDWTLGCVALEDDALLALRALMPAGQRAWLWVLP